ncbi:ionotropic glutamate receptor subunit ia [Danaus plexippus plexippus]|uniref:Ionotropic glutamate receptor subunit ia n=3 Tax=Danaus plexippus TaxID=13037 RepID=A0A212FHV0_DANPL|nr:ionotropic glutamate receptor subunit ia [Danaus plexippus plexippus]
MESVCSGVAEGIPEVAVLLEQAVAAGGGAAAGERGQSLEPYEPLAVPEHICTQASEGLLASVGGVEAADAAARAGLLLLLASPVAVPSPAMTIASTEPDHPLSAALEFYPRYDVLAEACAALCEAKGWKHAVLLHDGSGSAAPLIVPDHDTLALRVRQLPSREDDDALRNLLLVLKKFGAVNFIVWCSAECSVRVLDAAQRVGLLSERHSYLMLSLDLHTLPLEDFSYGGANITSLRLFDPESSAVNVSMEKWQQQYINLLGNEANEEIDKIISNPPTSLLLSYDAAKIVSEGMEYLDLPFMEDSPSCQQGTAAFHADTLLNYLRSEENSGATGPLWWEATGARGGVRLHVAELERGGFLRAAGDWSRTGGLTWRPRPPAPPPPPDAMTNRTFTVLIAQNQPYVMRQQSSERLSGNARYEGFCIELVDRLAQLLHFNYTFIEQADRAYGSLNKTTKQWNGMMRRLMDDKNVDFAITDLTITAEREEIVDFTTPFMTLGISILFHKPQPPAPELLAFLLPFSNGVWMCLGLAYVGSSLVLYVVGRLCPEEWQNPYPCIEEPSALENQFTLANALWFNLGAVLQQGSEIAPIAYGTRAVASIWWMFALVITSSYTANLATLLASKTSTELIRNVRELAENDQGITYGAKSSGSTYTFFEMSSSEPYKSMFQKMKDVTMPSTNEEGIEKVMNEKYAFFAESTTIDYTTERNCEVTRVGDLLDSKGYGIAMKKNSPYRQALNLALLNLQEAGILREMKHRWWKEMHGGGACQDKEDHATERLTIDNFKGLILVLTVGCALGIVMSCCDLAWSAWRHPRDPTRSFAASFWSELRFVFRFEQSEKPVRGALTPAPSSHDSPPSAHSERSELTTGSGVDGRGRGREEDDNHGEDDVGSRFSARSRRTSARRCSMHAASLRLARHTTPRR